MHEHSAKPSIGYVVSRSSSPFFSPLHLSHLPLASFVLCRGTNMFVCRYCVLFASSLSIAWTITPPLIRRFLLRLSACVIPMPCRHHGTKKKRERVTQETKSLASPRHWLHGSNLPEPSWSYVWVKDRGTGPCYIGSRYTAFVLSVSPPYLGRYYFYFYLFFSVFRCVVCMQSLTKTRSVQ